VAVTVEQETFVVLDPHYRIVEVGPSAEGGFGPLVGRNLWECFPGSEALFRPYYEKARRTREPEEFVQFYDGRVVRIQAVPRGEQLAVSWGVIHVIDALTVEDLQTSIQRTIELVDNEQAEMFRRDTRGSFRLIEGGA
jgi:hypothetical protein